MNQSQPAGRIRTAPTAKRPPASPDDSLIWMGGEASVGTQARRHLRQQQRNISGLPLTILALTFLGGLAIGSLVSSFLHKTRR